MCHSGRIYKDLCEAEMTENLCRKSIKNAVEVKSIKCSMKLTGLARNTYYNYKRQIRAELIAAQDLPKGASIFYEPPKSF